MRIVAFIAADPAQPGPRALAKVILDGKFLPAYFHGPDVADVVAQAERWWAVEQENRRTRAEAAERRAAARRKPDTKTTASAPAAPLAPVIDDEECV